MGKIKSGQYKHFKGGLYKVIGIAKHSETLEEFVVYINPINKKMWIRPKKMFYEKVLVKGKKIPRFTKIS